MDHSEGGSSLWSGWQDIAEREDGAALGVHLADLLSSDRHPRLEGTDSLIEAWCGAMFQAELDAPVLRLVVDAAGRDVEVHRRVFEDIPTRDRFMTIWCESGVGLTELALLALLRGGNACGKEIDLLARGADRGRRREKRGRHASWNVRREARRH